MVKVYPVARRILLLITDLEIGGTPTVVRELAIRLNRPPDVIIEVACLAPRGPVAEELSAAGIHVTALGCTSPFQLPTAVWKLTRLIKRGPIEQHPIERARVLTYKTRRPPFDTVFSFLVHANTVAAAASWFCRGVRFFQSIQTAQREPGWHWEVQAFAESAAERIVVPSRSVADAARMRSGVSPRKITIIPNAVEAEAFLASSVPLTNPRPYPIAFIGRLDPVKRIPDLLHAVKILSGLVTLDVYGAGELEGSLIQFVKANDLASLVTLRGSIPGPQPALQRAGMLVLPSEAEGFGLVLIEAMAAGVPVVATDVPGIRDVVRNGETGLMVPVASPEALAGAIRRVVEDRPLRERLIENGKRSVLERFGWAAILARYRDVLCIDSENANPQS